MTNEMDTIIAPKTGDISYSTYLKVSELLDLQHPLSNPAEHDETLFIIIHQVYELWFKLIHHELSEGINRLEQNEALGFLRKLKRVTTIQDTLINQVDIIETMTPSDFNRFRERLNPASGFQSYQFRLLEFRLGNRASQYLKFYKAQDAELAALEEAMNQPSLNDHLFRYLSRQGYEVPKELLERDLTKPYAGDERMVKLFKNVYDNPQKNYDLYMILESLIDFDEKILLWRYRHLTMVERMIGSRTGTGGSSGANYLAATTKKRAFPDIWAVRDEMGGAY